MYTFLCFFNPEDFGFLEFQWRERTLGAGLRSSSLLSACRFSRVLRLNRFIWAVTLISFLHLENFWRLIASSAFDVVTWQTILTLRRSLLSARRSCRTGDAASCGHSSPGNLRKSGPFFHLSFSSLTLIPRETSFATLCSPAMCCHWEGSELFWISLTLADIYF